MFAFGAHNYGFAVRTTFRSARFALCKLTCPLADGRVQLNLQTNTRRVFFCYPFADLIVFAFGTHNYGFAVRTTFRSARFALCKLTCPLADGRVQLNLQTNTRRVFFCYPFVDLIVFAFGAHNCGFVVRTTFRSARFALCKFTCPLADGRVHLNLQTNTRRVFFCYSFVDLNHLFDVLFAKKCNYYQFSILSLRADLLGVAISR